MTDLGEPSTLAVFDPAVAVHIREDLQHQSAAGRSGVTGLRAGGELPERGTTAGRAQSGLPFLWKGNRPYLPHREPLGRGSAGTKRARDIALAGIGLLVLSPLLLGTALAIRATSPGPALFSQDRIGRNDTRFRIYKFRSMRIDDCDVSGVNQVGGNDPRVTPFGRFLRRTSLDELPQLFNILKGDMSIVGPRPHVPGMLAGGRLYEEAVPYYGLRHRVKPGLTGWAQVNGYRGPTGDLTAARRRVDHDIAYIQNHSLWLDIKIITATALRELVGGTGL